jgi:DNA mismatch repair protein MSH5
MPAGPKSKLPFRNKGRRGGRASSASQSSSRGTSATAPSRCAPSRSSNGTSRSSRPACRIRTFTPQLDNGNNSESQLPPSALSYEQASEPGDDTLNEIVMAIDLQQKDTVGCCYYVARDEKLYFTEDVKLGGIPAIDACAYCPTQACRIPKLT